MNARAMTEEESGPTQRFITQSILDLIIPEASQLDIEEALSSASANADEDAPAGLTSIPQRKILFFDEHLPVYVILQTPYQEEDGLKAYIARLSIVLEAHAINGLGGEERDAAPQTVTREVLWSGKVGTKEDPVIVVEETADGEDEDQRDMLIIWKVTALLTRPRIRLQAPGILLKLSGSLEPAKSWNQEEANDPYLRSGVPFTSQNIFQALENDAFLKGAIPYLPASRLSHIASNDQPSRSSTLPLRTISRRAIQAYVALNAKFRYHRPRKSSQDSSTIASLDLEVPAYVQHALDIESVEVDFPSGQTNAIGLSSTPTLPKRCQPRDNIVFLYNLTPDQVFTNQSFLQGADLVRPLDLFISARVFVSPICSPVISLRWRTTVDISPTQTLSADRRQNSLKDRSNRQLVDSKSALRSSVDSQRPGTASLGISATFSAIDNATVGEPFHWDIFLVNRGTITRNLSIVVIAKSNTLESVQRTTSTPKDGAAKLALVFVEESSLFDLTRNAPLEPIGLVCLSTDLNVQTLPPNACSTFSLTLLPLLPGRLDLAALRFVDKETGDTLDVKDFPDVVVKGKIDKGDIPGRQEG